MSDDGVYLRRVRDPNPILLELARQVVDDTAAASPAPTRTLRFFRLALAARAAGVPLAYVLDELERRAREAGA